MGTSKKPRVRHVFVVRCTAAADMVDDYDRDELWQDDKHPGAVYATLAAAQKRCMEEARTDWKEMAEGDDQPDPFVAEWTTEPGDAWKATGPVRLLAPEGGSFEWRIWTVEVQS